MSRSIVSSASLVCAPLRLKNTADTRRSAAPLISSASTVLAKVGSVSLVGNRRDLRLVLGERRVEGRTKMLRRDLRKWRCVKGSVPLLQQRILSHCHSVV